MTPLANKTTYLFKEQLQHPQPYSMMSAVTPQLIEEYCQLWHPYSLCRFQNMIRVDRCRTSAIAHLPLDHGSSLNNDAKKVKKHPKKSRRRVPSLILCVITLQNILMTKLWTIHDNVAFGFVSRSSTINIQRGDPRPPSATTETNRNKRSSLKNRLHNSKRGPCYILTRAT